MSAPLNGGSKREKPSKFAIITGVLAGRTVVDTPHIPGNKRAAKGAAHLCACTRNRSRLQYRGLTNAMSFQ